MSTRSLVGIENKGGSIRFIYVHSDGYPDYNGKLLLQSFKTRQKVYRLVANGDASYIAPRINPRAKNEHKFNGKRQKDVCLFYGRDRGEADTESKIAKTPATFMKQDYGAEYKYYIDFNGVWHIDLNGKWIPLEKHPDIKKLKKSLTTV